MLCVQKRAASWNPRVQASEVASQVPNRLLLGDCITAASGDSLGTVIWLSFGGVLVACREHLESRCYHEQVQQAQYYRWGQSQKARGMAMPYCDELRRLRSAIYV